MRELLISNEENHLEFTLDQVSNEFQLLRPQAQRITRSTDTDVKQIIDCKEMSPQNEIVNAQRKREQTMPSGLCKLLVKCQ